MKLFYLQYDYNISYRLETCAKKYNSIAVTIMLKFLLRVQLKDFFVALINRLIKAELKSSLVVNIRVICPRHIIIVVYPFQFVFVIEP